MSKSNLIAAQQKQRPGERSKTRESHGPHVSNRSAAEPQAASAIGNLQVQRALMSLGIQTKLTTTQPGDPDEQEADRNAERIATSPKPDAAPVPCAACESSGATCPKCQEEKKVQRKAQPGVSQAASASVPALGGPGQPLSASARAFFEPHFGADFGGVRVHTDGAANHAAGAIGARAFTLGSDIAFARNAFAPDTSDGRRLLSHELTHVVQQSQPGYGPRIARDGNAGAPDKPDKPKLPSQEASVSPSGQTMSFENVVLGTNIEYMEPVMRQYIADHGEAGARKFRNRLRDKIYKEVPASDRDTLAADDIIGACPTEPLSNDALIYVAVDEALEDIFLSNKKWLADFEAKANEVVLGMLQESEDRVDEERIRYHVDWKDVEVTKYRQGRNGPISYKGTETRYSMGDTPESHAMADAATGLLVRKRKFDAAEKEMNDYAEENFSGATALAEIAMTRPGFYGSGDLKVRDHLNELRTARNLAKRDLDVFRIQKSGEFPILAAYASDEEIKEDELGTLQELAKGKSPAATNMIGKEIKTRYEHIAEVRDDITNHGGEDTKIWRVPRIINGTREMTGATPGTMYGRLVDDKVDDEKPGIWTSILLGLLQLVLVLAAPFTAGLTLIPAAAISVGQAYVHFKEYERAEMLRGTDFGALALSSEDPSLFWLAVDIIGAGFDVGAAAGAAMSVFRALAPAARAARAAKTLEAAEKAAQALERTATEVGGEALAKTVGQDARLGSEAMKVGETAEEAGALTRASEEMAAKELASGAQEAESVAGRTVKVSEAGDLWSCASPCTLLRERYKGLLRRKGTDWEKRLRDIENEAASIPKGKAGDEARKALAQRAASLEKEMRTTAMPGEWTSPLKDADEFKDLVNRRGSVAAELDHHPTGWTGKDEARFRYGEKIDPEPGYRWTLDENGALRYDRLDAELPLRRYNAATGVFEEAADGKTIIKASKGAEEAKPLADIPKKQRDAMEVAFKKRGDLIAERDRLEALQEAGKLKDDKELRKIYGQINEQSRQMGENAAEAVMKGKGGKKIYPSGKTYSTSGDFDQVWKQGDRFQLVEAKGGSSGLGTRLVEGVHAEQGTKAYAQSIAEHMAKHGATKEIKKLGEDLLTAIAHDKVDYFLVRSPVGEKLGTTVIGDVKVSQFAL